MLSKNYDNFKFNQNVYPHQNMRFSSCVTAEAPNVIHDISRSIHKSEFVC